MSKIFNKSTLKDKFKKGNTGKAQEKMGNGWFSKRTFADLPQDPFQFANSNELSKLKRKK